MSAQKWQCVMLSYGTKFPDEDINRIARAVRRHSPGVVRISVMTDRERPGVDDNVVQLMLPDFYRQSQFMRGGCHAKIAMFEPGFLQNDVPAIYIDLDSAILGDLGRALSLRKGADRIMMLHHLYVPFGPLGRFLHRRTQGRKYARGNASMVVFDPDQSSYIDAAFKDQYQQNGLDGLDALSSDEQFISWSAQMKIQTIPSRIIAKFHYEFMSVIPGWPLIKAQLQWVRAKRRNLAAVTFCDEASKPEYLLQLHDGQKIMDRRYRRLTWSVWHIGDIGKRLREYYS